MNTARKLLPLLWFVCLFVPFGPSACATAQVGSVHARLAWSAEALRVVEVPPGSAAEAGLLADDRILEIDGEDVDGMPLKEIVEKLRGPVGSTVQLKIFRNGTVMILTIQRAPFDK